MDFFIFYRCVITCPFQYLYGGLPTRIGSITDMLSQKQRFVITLLYDVFDIDMLLSQR